MRAGAVDLRQPRPGGEVAQDVQFRPLEQGELAAAVDQVGPGQGRAPPRPQHRAQAVCGQRQQLQGEPERGRRRARPGALERYLAQVQLIGGEVGVGRVVQVVLGHPGVAEDHRAAAVGLQAVLVRVDDDRVAVGDGGERRRRHPVGGVVGDEAEEAAVGGVHVHPGAVAAGERDDLVHRVDRAKPGGAHGGHHRPDSPALQQLLKRRKVHGGVGGGGHRHRLDAEQVAHPPVGVVRVGAVRDRAARVELARDEQRLQVGDGAAAGQVAQVRGEAEHRGQLRHHLLLHPGGGGPPVERVVVGVDQHRAQVADDRRRVRRLEHLPDVAGVEERVVVPQPPVQFGGRPLQPVRWHVKRGMRRESAVLGHPLAHRLHRLPQLPAEFVCVHDQDPRKRSRSFERERGPRHP